MAELPPPLPRRAGTQESCVKTTPGRKAAPPRSPRAAASPASSQPPGTGTRGPRNRRGSSARQLGEAGRTRGSLPGGRAGEQGVGRLRSSREPPTAPRLPPSPGANTRRPPAGPVTTPAPGRRRSHTRGPNPSDSTRPLPGTQPGPTARPAAGPRPCAPSRLTCAPRQLCTSSPAPRAPSGHAPTPRPGLPRPR